MREILKFFDKANPIHKNVHKGTGPIEIFSGLVFISCNNDLRSFAAGDYESYKHGLDVVTDIGEGAAFHTAVLSLNNGNLVLRRGGTTRRGDIFEVIGSLTPEQLTEAEWLGLDPRLREKRRSDGGLYTEEHMLGEYRIQAARGRRIVQ